MLAIIQYLEVQKHFLEEAKSQFKIWIDYKNLEYFIKAQKLNLRQARQILYLLRFDFILKYIASKSMGSVDSLSKRVYQVKEVERDNKNQVMLKKKWLELE